MPTELHCSLQAHYAGDTGVVEAKHGRYKLDVLRDGVAYEIQTGSFFKIRRKIEALAETMPVVVVYPVPETKFIVRQDPETGEELSCRRSPKHGRVLDVFPELRHLAAVLREETVSLEVVRTVEREIRSPETRRGRYHKRVSLLGRELVEVVDVVRFENPEDYLELLPPNLPERFSVADLAQAAGLSRWLAGHMSYALRRLGTIERVGKQGNAYLYAAIGPSSVALPGGNDGWLEIRCSQCNTMGFEAKPGSVVRWRCGKCRSLEVWPEEPEN